MTFEKEEPAKEKRSWWARGLDKVDITPAAIAEVQFTTRRLSFHEGYDETEVDDFLDRVGDKMAEVMRQNSRLRTALEPFLPSQEIDRIAGDRYEEIGIDRRGEP